jgi:hypothetical protein
MVQALGLQDREGGGHGMVAAGDLRREAVGLVLDVAAVGQRDGLGDWFDSPYSCWRARP